MGAWWGVLSETCALRVAVGLVILQVLDRGVVGVRVSVQSGLLPVWVLIALVLVVVDLWHLSLDATVAGAHLLGKVWGLLGVIGASTDG